MTDYALFVVAPYVAALFFVLASVIRYGLSRPLADWDVTTFSGGDSSRLLIAVTRVGLGVVALGHLVAFAAPDRVLLWNQRFARLLTLEAAGMVAASVALAGLVAACVRHVRAPNRRGAWSPIDVVAGTLVLMGMISGLAVAIRYRWASSWAEVTVVPYLRSLAHLDESATLVTRLPFLVRLHIFGAFALLAAAPMSGIIRVVTLPLQRLRQWTPAPAANLRRPAWSATAAWGTTRVKDACAALVQDAAEEN